MYNIMSQRGYKRRFSPENHRYEYQYIHGGSLFSFAKSFGKKLLGKSAKKAVTKAANSVIHKKKQRPPLKVGKRSLNCYSNNLKAHHQKMD